MDAATRLAYTAATHSSCIHHAFTIEVSHMAKAISIALIVGGVVLLYFGGQSFHSLSNDMSRLFTGAPTNKTIFLIAGGAVALLAGLTGLASSGRKR
ncbi:hypothetical protein JCM10599A_07770 [Paraburkholderia kururiensis]